MIDYRLRFAINLTELGQLRERAWGGKDDGQTWAPVLERSFSWVTAHDGDQLIGFVNVAWDGGVHVFLLDTTVHPDWQHRGIGTELVRRAAEACRNGELEWLHVDYDPDLEQFYGGCGFKPTHAGLLRLI